MLAAVANADSASTVTKKYSVFIYSEAEPHAMYAIYIQTLTVCVLQYLNGVGAVFLWLACVRNDKRHQSPQQIEICRHHFLYSW